MSDGHTQDPFDYVGDDEAPLTSVQSPERRFTGTTTPITGVFAREAPLGAESFPAEFGLPSDFEVKNTFISDSLDCGAVIARKRFNSEPWLSSPGTQPMQANVNEDLLNEYQLPTACRLESPSEDTGVANAPAVPPATFPDPEELHVWKTYELPNFKQDIQRNKGDPFTHFFKNTSEAYSAFAAGLVLKDHYIHIYNFKNHRCTSSAESSLYFKSFGAQETSRYLAGTIRSFVAGEAQFPMTINGKRYWLDWPQMTYTRTKSKAEGNSSGKDSGVLLWKHPQEAVCVNMFVQRLTVTEPPSMKWPDVQIDNEGMLASDDHLLNAIEHYWTAATAAAPANVSDLSTSSCAFGEFPADVMSEAKDEGKSQGKGQRKGKGMGNGMP